MQLKVIGSSSKGNCYVLETLNSALVIECGVSLSEVKKAINFDISKIAGAIVSHSHQDHAGHIREFIKAGINIYGPIDIFENIEDCSHLFALENEKIGCIGKFQIMPFELVHDVPCFGYLIDHPESGLTCFITDTHYCPFTFPGLNNIIIEANYDEEILDNNIERGSLPVIVRNRVLKSHLSLETCKEFLLANDLSAVNNIVLIHLSDGNSHALNFKNDIQGLTGKQVFIANKGMNIEFNKTTF